MESASTQPLSGSPLETAFSWLSDLLTGSLATSLAIIAIALIGMSLLQGRTDLRRSGQVIIGCFLIFGAHAVAAGIMGASNSTPSQAALPESPAPAPPPPSVPNIKPSNYDPYAGASVPQL